MAPLSTLTKKIAFTCFHSFNNFLPLNPKNKKCCSSLNDSNIQFSNAKYFSKIYLFNDVQLQSFQEIVWEVESSQNFLNNQLKVESTSSYWSCIQVSRRACNLYKKRMLVCDISTITCFRTHMSTDDFQNALNSIRINLLINGTGRV